MDRNYGTMKNPTNDDERPGAVVEDIQMSSLFNDSINIFEEDDEFDYLPIPDNDENDAQELAKNYGSVVKKIPYQSIYKTSLPFDSMNRLCFLPGQKITVKIIDAEVDSTQILNPNLYIIEISHGGYQWQIRRRYKHFQSLHGVLILYKTKSTILPVMSKEARERKKSFQAHNPNLSRFPKTPEALIRGHNQLDERKILLQAYLQSVLKSPVYRSHPEVLKFLDVSHLSFITDLGPKLRESMVRKKSGGRRFALSCFSCCSVCQPGKWLDRWLILKDTYLAYVRPEDGLISDVLLMDQDFKVNHGLLNTGWRDGLVITNLSRRLSLKCFTQRRAEEWHSDIIEVVNKTGKEYTSANRYRSFVPTRPNSYCNWFVDGASYMAAVGDALEAAKDEIFITDWMLSPELYLKRPMLEGEKWRLDEILKRKADEGVKVFILVYKELEIALGINSYYTKQILTAKNRENIKVLRHPNGIKLWSHHEKCVVIDQKVAFLGGIDLCYGRWDTRKHRLTDVGSIHLSNIYGNQDEDALNNILNHIPNIVQKQTSSDATTSTTAATAAAASIPAVAKIAARAKTVAGDVSSAAANPEDDSSSGLNVLNKNAVVDMITYVVAEDGEDEDGEGEGRNDDDAKVDDDDDDDDDDDKKRIPGVSVSKGESWSYTNPMMVSDEPHKPRRATVKEKPSPGEDHGHHQPRHGVLSAKKKRENMKSKTAQSLDSANILSDSDTHRLSTIIDGDDVIITANKYADDDRHERSSVARASADAQEDNLHSDPVRSSAGVDDNFQSILRESASSKESSSGGGDGGCGGTKPLLGAELDRQESADQLPNSMQSFLRKSAETATEAAYPFQSADHAAAAAAASTAAAASDDISLNPPQDIVSSKKDERELEDAFKAYLNRSSDANAPSDTPAEPTSKRAQLKQHLRHFRLHRSASDAADKDASESFPKRWKKAFFFDRHKEEAGSDEEEEEEDAADGWRKKRKKKEGEDHDRAGKYAWIGDKMKFHAATADRDGARDDPSNRQSLPTPSNNDVSPGSSGQNRVVSSGGGATRKTRNLFKNLAEFKILFHRQQSQTLDVADDGVERTWDTKVFTVKEFDEPDQKLDEQLPAGGLEDGLKIWVGKDYCNFICKDFVQLDKPFADLIDRRRTPRLPWHDVGAVVFGKAARDVARHFIQRWNFTKLQKAKANSGMPFLIPRSNEHISIPKWVTKNAFCCNCQILRSSAAWSAGIEIPEYSIHTAYTDLIVSAQHYIYIENQFFISIADDRTVVNQISAAIYEKILAAHRAQKKFKVYVVLPLLPAFEGQLGTPTGSSIQAIIHWNYASICRGNGNSLLERLVKVVPDPFQYISFYGLRKHEEMLGKITTELVYVHSKLMIVDDRSVIIGSANINDRSLLGTRDSELAILVQDPRFVDSKMDGQPFKAGAFACSLRKSLFREHLGLQAGDDVVDVSDPVCDEFYKGVWMKRASINTSIYEKVFSCIPTDEVFTLEQLRAYQRRDIKAEKDPDEAREMLKKVKGQLVLMPLLFLSKEYLAPTSGKEALAPTVVWT